LLAVRDHLEHGCGIETPLRAIGEADHLLSSPSISLQSKGRSMDASFCRICFALSGLLPVGAGAMAGERSRQNVSPIFGVSLPTGYLVLRLDHVFPEGLYPE
jgi:hypothetical protein